jgi:hypothetical protein
LPGGYALTVEAAGFRKAEYTNIESAPSHQEQT